MRLLILFILLVLQQLALVSSQEVISQAIQKPFVGGCDIVVIGAGWSGVYFAWRLTLDFPVYAAHQVCIFEANYRIGGRVYSYNSELLEDLHIDLGAYRFAPTHYHIYGLIKNRFNLPIHCYDPAAEICTYYVISDPYLNNKGYVNGIEAMLQPFLAAGGRIFMNHELMGLYASPNPDLVQLAFKNGLQMDSSIAFLNIPNTAVQALNQDSLLFTEGSAELRALFANGTEEEPIIIVYVYYEDAWWINHLGLSSGSFYSAESIPPVLGRYHDKTVKCQSNGSHCYGTIPVVYGNDVQYSYYLQFRSETLDHLTIWNKDNNYQILEEIHQVLMNYHHDLFLQAGVDPSSIQPPTEGYMSYWKGEEQQARPGVETLKMPVEEAQSLVSRPLINRNIFMANQAWTSYGWAEPAVAMTEEILQSYFHLPPPNWF